MIDARNRQLIMDAFGGAVDALVRDLYSEASEAPSTVQEPDITSRICQRVEDKLDNSKIGDYVIRVIAQSMPDRGPNSLERITGADLVMSVSLDGPGGFDKAIFVQAKYDRNIDRDELLDACRRMKKIVGKDGIYVWIYEEDGVKVLSSNQVSQMQGNSFDGLHRRSMAGLIGRILDCYAGSKAWGIPKASNRREILKKRLQEVRAQNALDLTFKRDR